MYETDRDYTPPAAPGAHTPFRSPGCYVNITLVALFVMVTVSLALNFALIVALLRARSAALDALDQAVAVTNGLGNEVFSIPVHVDQNVPVSVGVPFAYQDTIMVNTTIPISTTVSVPLDLAGQTIVVALPVRTAVPVKLQVPVSLSKTIEVNASVPVKFDTNVEVRLADTPLPGYLARLRAAIESVR
jgi:hypothetical protein